jgi:hypothetical protein
MSETRHKTTIELGVEDREVDQLQRKIERTFDQRAVDAFTRGVERATKAFEKMGTAAQRAGVPLTGGSVGGSHFGGGGASGGGAMAYGGLGAEVADLRRAIAELADQHRRTNDREQERDRKQGRGGGGGGYFAAGAAMAGGAGAAMANGQFISHALSGLPVIGPALGATAQQAVALHGEFAQQMMAQAGAFGRTGVARGYVGAGTPYGIMPGAMPGILGGLAGTSGLDGGRLTDALPLQLALSQLLGVEGAGGIVGAGETSEGSVGNPRELMVQAVADGISAGIRVTRLDQYLQNVSGWVESVRSQGIDMSPESALQMIAGFSAAGLRGEAGVAAAHSLGDAMGRAGRGRGVAHGLALRAAGFGQPGVTYQDAVERLERRESGTMRNMLGYVQGMGGSTQDRAVFLRNMMEQIGGQMSARQARALIEGNFDPTQADPELAREMVRQRGEDAGGIFGPGAFQAGMAGRRIALGGSSRVAGASVAMQNAELNLMNTVIPLLAPAVERFSETIDRLTTVFDREGLSGLMREIMHEMGRLMTEAAHSAIVAPLMRSFGADDATVRQHAEAIEEFFDDPSGSLQGIGDAVIDNLTRPDSSEIRLPADPSRRLNGYMPARRPDGSEIYRDGRPVMVPSYADGEGGPSASAAQHLRRAAELLDRAGLPMDGAVGVAPV